MPTMAVSHRLNHNNVGPCPEVYIPMPVSQNYSKKTTPTNSHHQRHARGLVAQGADAVVHRSPPLFIMTN